MSKRSQQDWKTLFTDHLAERHRLLEADLGETSLDGLILSSGTPFRYFADDRDAPFETSGHFRHWCPIDGPHHLLVLIKGEPPVLVRHAPEDYWYEQAPLGEPFWHDRFVTEEAGTVDDVWKALSRFSTSGALAYVGDSPERASGAIPGIDVEPKKLLSRLDWSRAVKTDYELACLEEATRLGAIGHHAAHTAFIAGGSERDIHYAFIEAMGMLDAELPYNTIIAFDEKAAILHYEGKRRTTDARVLLIDAGAQWLGYASDITRTYAKPGTHERFIALLQGMEALQQRLCEAIRPGLPYGDLHHQAHLEIAALLQSCGIVSAEPDEIVDEGWSRPFFPHGLGHHLGIYVHDVGGHLAAPDGTPAPPPEQHPFLRNTRRLEPNHVFTMEPGLYFIPMLLRELRQGAASQRFDWELIDALTPCGGIRIEDNVVVTSDGHRNLTRQYLD